ncbi:GAF and ANTAR domain-containing protein [Blastococcus sp. TF02A-30]|uniref:GAF and ANTAR domain-containing protein n=1 Tax=Blastococcus sp. TF02A-30 TaxID=2250580 RepID=UPI000DE9F729|nr:GAF and ANTAR domain-containing protein [Blastococcus sp. TF02A-30]RBY84939.1 hypothetical protein DQ241_16675 [Blastococcus sp. TF02A-30]
MIARYQLQSFRTFGRFTFLPIAADHTDHAVRLEGGALHHVDVVDWRTGQMIRVDDAAGDRRWPKWSEAATQLGVRSALSAPLLAGGEKIGAIKLYALQAGRFDEHAEQVMVLFARQAAILLTTTRDLANARALSRRLTDALADRDVVSQAAGVLLGRGAPDREVAFAELVAAAERSGRSVREVAVELLATVTADDADSSPV